MAKYDENKLLSELGKLTPDEQFQALERISNFVQKGLEAEKKLADEKSELLNEKIKKLNNGTQN
jgi:hypothetical protein